MVLFLIFSLCILSRWGSPGGACGGFKCIRVVCVSVCAMIVFKKSQTSNAHCLYPIVSATLDRKIRGSYPSCLACQSVCRWTVSALRAYRGTLTSWLAGNFYNVRADRHCQALWRWALARTESWVDGGWADQEVETNFLH